MLASDEELVRRVRRGERNAFSDLVERYEQPALAVARSILICPHDARDAVQDAFVAAYVRINRLFSPHKFGGWFLRIVTRQALWNLRRRTARQKRLVPMIAESARDVTPPPLDIANVLRQLPQQECVVVSLRHLNGLSVGEIARITGRPVGTVTKQLSRAYARMRPWMDERS